MDISEFGSNLEKDKKEISKQPKAEATTLEHAEKHIESSFSQWAIGNNNKFMPTYPTIKKLPSGFYTLTEDNLGNIIFVLQTLNVDELILFSNTQMESILNEINNFWEKKKQFTKYGFLHKRGYLFYGPAGSGKTCLIDLIINHLIESGGIILNCNCHPRLVSEAISKFRTIEPDRAIICLFEDIDAIIKTYSEEIMLSLLDGDNRFNNVLNIATTNYPEKLDPRIVARPRRFDRVIKIDTPSKGVRREFFEIKLKISGEELDKFVEKTEGFSFGAMAELVISIKCFDKEFEETIEILKKLMVRKSRASSSEYYGFEETGFKTGIRN